MSAHHDPELDDVLQDDELRRLAAVLRSSTTPEPPLDDAFRTGLRRQLMQAAWSMTEGRGSWFRRAFAPPGIAWAGAVAGLLLIASVAVWTATQQSGGTTQIVVASSVADKSNVALQQPILLAFNQPMDHQSTEAAVQITPATSVAYAWDAQSRTLSVTPTGGTLAPNTQYQVTIGPGAKTASNQPLTTPQTITFVTQAPAVTPAPTPLPRPTPANPLAEKQVVTLNGTTSPALQWSADSSSIYFEDGKGTLLVVPAKGGSTSVIASNAGPLAISPTGDRLAWVESGKIEVLTFASGMNTTMTPAPQPTLVGWAKDKVIWAAKDGIYEQTEGGETLLAPLAAEAIVVSLAPDGGHAIYSQNNTLNLLDLTTGRSTPIGGNIFGGWAPDGSQLLYYTNDNVVVANLNGVNQATLPLGDATWSSSDAILLGGDTTISEVRPDGSHLTHLANGTYHLPVWAPDGSTFVFVRGNALWVGTAPALPPEPTVLDEASAVVTKFMDARLAGRSDDATALLDDSGKKAYGSGGLKLTITGDPGFSRYYVLTQEATGTQPDTVRVVVRLVLAHNKKDVSGFEETLTLVRDATSKQFLIDQAAAGPQRALGVGPEVVSVDVSGTTSLLVTFDSDLDPATVNGGVVVLDSKGSTVDATVTYANKVVTISGLDLKEGKQYRLVVQNTVRDVQGHSVTPEYDLDLFGPAAKKHGQQKVSGAASASPSPIASPAAAS